MFAPVVRLEVDYKCPVRYDDVVIVETKISRIGNSSIEFNYNIFNKDGQSLIATAKTINVFIGKQGNKIRVPDEIRKILDD